MRNLRDDIQKAKKEISLNENLLKEVSHLEYEEILKKINSKFLTTNKYDDKIWWWQSYKDLKSYAIHFKKGLAFEILDKLLPNKEIKYWFIASEENGKYWLYESGIETIKTIIGEMYGFEYYIVDKKYNWILCENHHDILIALGKEIADKLWKYEIKTKPIGLIENTFELSERGLILCLKYNFEKMFMTTGMKVKLVKPNGKEITTEIRGIAFETMDILIENKYSKKDIPIGTEMWLIE